MASADRPVSGGVGHAQQYSRKPRGHAFEGEILNDGFCLQQPRTELFQETQAHFRVLQDQTLEILAAEHANQGVLDRLGRRVLREAPAHQRHFAEEGVRP